MSTSPNLMKTFIQTNFLVSQTCFKKIITQMPCCGSFLQTWELFCPKTRGAYRAKWGAPRDLRTPQDPGTQDHPNSGTYRPSPVQPQGAVGGVGQMRSTIADMDPVKRGRFENIPDCVIHDRVPRVMWDHMWGWQLWMEPCPSPFNSRDTLV